MKKCCEKFYKENKVIVWAAIIAIIISVGVLVKVKDEVTRFTLIMPVFAGFILFSILVSSDEDLEDGNGFREEKPRAKKKTKKQSSKK